MAHITIHADAKTPVVNVEQLHIPEKEFYVVRLNLFGGDQTAFLLDTFEQVVNLRDQLDTAIAELANNLEFETEAK